MILKLVEPIVKRYGLKVVPAEIELDESGDTVVVYEIQLPDGRPIMYVDNRMMMCMDEPALDEREYVIVNNLVRDLQEAGFQFDWPEECKKIRMRP